MCCSDNILGCCLHVVVTSVLAASLNRLDVRKSMKVPTIFAFSILTYVHTVLVKHTSTTWHYSIVLAVRLNTNRNGHQCVGNSSFYLYDMFYFLHAAEAYTHSCVQVCWRCHLAFSILTYVYTVLVKHTSTTWHYSIILAVSHTRIFALDFFLPSSDMSTEWVAWVMNEKTAL